VTYDNTNSGVLFKNDKGDNPKRPDYRGSANWNGAEFDISGWVNESKKDGKKFLKLKFEPKKAAPPKATRAPVMDETPFKDDEDLPF
jgi:uncharacterized protein (DUF736 family)